MEDDKVLRDASKAKDPYRYMAICVFDQVFKDIAAYFFQRGTKEEIKSGKRSLNWVIKMRGNFRLLAGATNQPLDNFYQMCVWKISEIKKNARFRISDTITKVKGDRKQDTGVVSKERGRKDPPGSSWEEGIRPVVPQG